MGRFLYCAQQATDTDLVERSVACGAEALEDAAGTGMSAVDRGEKMDPLILILLHLAEIRTRLANPIQNFGYLE
jgi:hypothetical protein